MNSIHHFIDLFWALPLSMQIALTFSSFLIAVCLLSMWLEYLAERRRSRDAMNKRIDQWFKIIGEDPESRALLRTYIKQYIKNEKI